MNENVLKKYNVQIAGDGKKVMMFAHGYGCDQNMWRYVAPEFYKDYKVVLFDHIGSGKSDKKTYSPLRYNSLQAYADDVLTIARELDFKDAVFVGHSVSAMIGILAAAKDPGRFESLVLIGPSPRYIDDAGYVGGFKQQDIEGLLETLEANYLGWSQAMAPVIMGNAERPELSQELTNSFCQMDPEIARQFARVTFLSDNRADLPKVKTARSLILQCSQDVIAPQAVGEYVHQKLANSELVIMKATGHCPNLSAPAETVQLMKKFLH